MNDTTWTNDTKIPELPRLEGSASADVAIIGGGLAGITCAYFLAKSGKSVIVVDKGMLSQSVTACTTAFLTRSLDTDTADLKKIFGGAYKSILRSHEGAIDTVERIIQEEKIECGFARVPNYYVALTKRSKKSLEEEKELMQGADLAAEVVPAKTFPFKNEGALLLPNQARFHPLQYVVGLRNAAQKLGAKFYDHTEAKDISGKKNLTVTFENRATITATDVIIATYNPFIQPLSFRTKKGMYRSYVLELSIPKGTIPMGLYEDNQNPYTYFRVESNGDRDRMIIGGGDHRNELKFDPDRGYNLLERYAKETLGISDYHVVQKWSGPILEQSDGIALIGRMSKYSNRFVATAFSGNGMTYSTIAGMLLTDMINGVQNPLEQIYRPTRALSLKAILIKGKDYMEEFIDGVSNLLLSSKK